MRNPARRAPALALPFVAVPLCSLSVFRLSACFPMPSWLGSVVQPKCWLAMHRFRSMLNGRSTKDVRLDRHF